MVAMYVPSLGYSFRVLCAFASLLTEGDLTDGIAVFNCRTKNNAMTAWARKSRMQE